jgi:ribonuclease Z
MSLTLTFLGTGAAIPTLDRNVASLAVQREGETLLFDCGEGTQRQMMRYGVGFSLGEIFFTHYHSDHLLGLTGLVRTMGMQDRSAPGAARVLGGMLSVGVERNKFPVEIVEVQPGDRLARADYEIVVFPTEHRADTVGYALVEGERLGRFHPERARELGVPEGPLWGRLHRGETIELPDGRRVAPSDETGHSTASEAARVALEAGVRRLVLTHISARYSREAPELALEAQALFPETIVARDGLALPVPFRDD